MRLYSEKDIYDSLRPRVTNAELDDIMLPLKPVKAISLDNVKQAREEIDNLDRYFDNDYFSGNRDSMFKCDEVLAILDKLIAESET